MATALLFILCRNVWCSPLVMLLSAESLVFSSARSPVSFVSVAAWPDILPTIFAIAYTCLASLVDPTILCQTAGLYVSSKHSLNL